MATRVLGDGPPAAVDYAFDGSIAVNLYDLMYHDSDDVKPVSSQADGGTLAANQASAAPLFAGIAQAARLSTDPAVTNFPVIPDAIVDIACSSATFEVGDKVTFVEDSGGTYLENAKVVKTTDETLAIGYCVKREASAVTTVRVRLISRVTPANASPDATAQLTSATLPVLVFNGATGENEIRVPTNLADALSIESTAGDILVIDTTTGAVAVTLTTSASAGLTLASHVTMGDAKNIILNATTGTKIGTAVTQKLGFWNVTPVVQPASADQADQGAMTTVGSNTGTAGAGLSAITDTSMNDNSAAIMNDFAALREDIVALDTLLTAVRTALVDTGIMKGAA